MVVPRCMFFFFFFEMLCHCDTFLLITWYLCETKINRGTDLPRVGSVWHHYKGKKTKHRFRPELNSDIFLHHFKGEDGEAATSTMARMARETEESCSDE